MLTNQYPRVSLQYQQARFKLREHVDLNGTIDAITGAI